MNELELTAAPDAISEVLEMAIPRARRIIIELGEDEPRGGLAQLALDQLNGVLAESERASLDDLVAAGQAALGGDQLAQMVRYLRTVDPSDTRPGEAPIDMLTRIVEFYRGSGDSRFADEDDQ